MGGIDEGFPPRIDNIIKGNVMPVVYLELKKKLPFVVPWERSRDNSWWHEWLSLVCENNIDDIIIIIISVWIT